MVFLLGCAIKLWRRVVCRIGIGGCIRRVLTGASRCLSDDAWSTCRPAPGTGCAGVHEGSWCRYGMWFWTDLTRAPDSPTATLSVSS